MLIDHLEPSKVVRFIAACKLGEGDYLTLKQQLFAKETVATFYSKIEAYQNSIDKS